MGAEFSHFEARNGNRVVKGDHASVLHRLVGDYVPVFTGRPDANKQPSTTP